MKIYTQILLFFLLIIGGACQSSNKGLAGKYGAEGYENSYDTLWLRSDSTFKRKFIQKFTNHIFTQEGKWRTTITQGSVRIYLDSFYMNDDSKIVDDTIFKNLSHHGTSLKVDKLLKGFRLLQNGDLGWYYNKVE